MAQYFRIHPINPQERLVAQAARILEQGGVIVYPTDTTYGLGCLMSNRKGVDRILRIKRLPATHQLSIICADLSHISRFARYNNQIYRLLKRFLPGPYTFVLEATRDVPKKILPKRKTIGLRIPDHPVCLELMRHLNEPILSTSFRLPDAPILSDPELIRDQANSLVDLIVDSGQCPEVPSTIVNLTSGYPEILREGAGDPSVFQ
ncbi:MAG: threonylcarbamoyl-AMP synthase [Magnetococcales bacterium]|nr:threonylcarbamoyl-AMP synthase [Magnetococcales bacterium]